MSEPICGNCGKPRSKHFVDGYCFDNTNGDTFTSSPSDSTLIGWIIYTMPILYKHLVAAWKKEHGNG